MCPLSSSSGTVSVNVSLPWSRSTDGDRLVVGQELGELGDAAVVAELLLDRVGTAQVADHELEPGHDERRLAGAGDQLVVDELGVLGEDLPVRPEPDPGAGLALRDPLALAGQARLRLELRRVGTVVREDAGNPRWNDMPCWDGDRSTSTSSRDESALTTEAPTPCRPPVATYEPPPNLPPACSLVKTTSTPGRPVGLLVDRDAAPVVVDLGRVVGVQGDLDPGRGVRRAPRRRRCR